MENNTDFFANFRQQYEEEAFLRQCAINNFVARLANQKALMARIQEGYNIIEGYDYRIKSYDSTLAKLTAKGWPLTAKSLRNLHDIAGIRIITPYKDDIEKVVGLLKQQRSIEVVAEKDYVAHPKKNGYKSYHVVALQTLHLFDIEIVVPIEIQIRSLNMHSWAHWEHESKYKNPAFIQEPGLHSLSEKTEALQAETVESFEEIAEKQDLSESIAMEVRDKTGVRPATEFIHVASAGIIPKIDTDEYWNDIKKPTKKTSPAKKS